MRPSAQPNFKISAPSFFHLGAIFCQSISIKETKMLLDKIYIGGAEQREKECYFIKSRQDQCIKKRVPNIANNITAQDINLDLKSRQALKTMNMVVFLQCTKENKNLYVYAQIKGDKYMEFCKRLISGNTQVDITKYGKLIFASNYLSESIRILHSLYYKYNETGVNVIFNETKARDAA